MINNPTPIFAARLRSLESLVQVLSQMPEHRSLTLREVFDLIDDDEQYFVVHNIQLKGNTDKRDLVQGDSLTIFIQDYIQPGLGDGLDMHVFPAAGDWCLIFEIDGHITYRSHC